MPKSMRIDSSMTSACDLPYTSVPYSLSFHREASSLVTQSASIYMYVSKRAQSLLGFGFSTAGAMTENADKELFASALKVIARSEVLYKS